jgi:UDP-N-acetylmuramoyl-tripeptide--D-alanyl-D-alanine ligase
VKFETRMTGRHSVLNILAGLAVAQICEIPLHDLVGAVAQLAPGKMRGERRTIRGITVLNDSYNSNPEAARAMIDVLSREPAQRRIAVLGEMLELGSWAEPLHRDLGRYAASHDVDVLIGIRGASRWMIDESRRSGMSDASAFFFEEAEDAGEFLRSFAKAGDAILFKGSRGTKVENALAKMEE